MRFPLEVTLAMGVRGEGSPAPEAPMGAGHPLTTAMRPRAAVSEDAGAAPHGALRPASGGRVLPGIAP